MHAPIPDEIAATKQRLSNGEATGIEGQYEVDVDRRATRIARLARMLDSDVYRIMHIDNGEAFKAIERLNRKKLLLMKTLRIESYAPLMRDHSKDLLKPWLLELFDSSSICTREVLFLWNFVAVKFLRVECDRLSRMLTPASTSLSDIDGAAIVRATTVDKAFLFYRCFQFEWSPVASVTCESNALQRVVLTFVQVHLLHHRSVATPQSELRVTRQGRTLSFTSTDRDHIVRVERKACDGIDEGTLVDANTLELDAFRLQEAVDHPCTPRNTLADLRRLLVQSTDAFIGDTVKRRIGALYCVLSEGDADYARCLRCVEWANLDRTNADVTVLVVEG
ncbi:hypothetical protein CYMTET_35610 [Cymbomonas tetramitiformis]|uniref:Uncharacterized protein n=1 Tax=Cymbomonas tetramitiformis TaxID=36881 RepID=A0AAE0KNM6_9CHLO|nr:hypothetical protein CYMTET_35610 [Cymbomonas tetramitiformis]